MTRSGTIARLFLTESYFCTEINIDVYERIQVDKIELIRNILGLESIS